LGLRSWTINSSIRSEVVACRSAGIQVRHRWSVPDFERFLGGEELGKDKPYSAFARVNGDAAVKGKVRTLIQDLFSSDLHDPAHHNSDADFLPQVSSELSSWLNQQGSDGGIRFTGKAG
jgi:putative ATP-dependent endonuclease of OLD family